MAPQVVAHPGTRPTERIRPVSERKSIVWGAASAEADPHPHCCWRGLVFLGYSVFDEEIGEEVEQIEIVPCRRCGDANEERVPNDER
jgi:hypothetical protein